MKVRKKLHQGEILPKRDRTTERPSDEYWGNSWGGLERGLCLNRSDGLFPPPAKKSAREKGGGYS